MPQDSERREWIIQRCLNAFESRYEDWTGYCERLLAHEEMVAALAECEHRWPDYQFRGHNLHNQKADGA